MRSIAAALFLSMLLAAPVAALEYRYSATPRGFVPYAINDSGTMAGTLYVDTAGILRNGVVEPIAEWLNPSGINNLESVVLWKSAGSFSYDGHEFTEILIPDAIFVTAEDINDHGMIVGYYRKASYPWTQHAFLVLDGVIQSIDHPEYDGGPRQDLYFLGNNNWGQVVGTYVGDTGLEGFLFQDGVFTAIAHQRPQDINDHDQIVGIWDNRGFLDSGGEVIGIEFPGALITSPRSINNLGQIVGFYQLPGDAARYGFIASPVIPAGVVLGPRDLRPGAGGVLVATVELPSGCSTSDIAWVTIEEVNGHAITPIAPIGTLGVKDRDRDGIKDVTFKFDASDLAAQLNAGWNSITLSGELESGVFFKGVVQVPDAWR